MDCIDNLNYAQLGFLKRLGDRNALVDVHRDGLLGHPAVLMFEDFKRCFGVAFLGGLMQYLRHFALTVRFAFDCGHLGQWVKLAQMAVLVRPHTRCERQRVAFEPQFSGVVNCLQARLSSLDMANCKRQ